LRAHVHATNRGSGTVVHIHEHVAARGRQHQAGLEGFTGIDHGLVGRHDHLAPDQGRGLERLRRLIAGKDGFHAGIQFLDTLDGAELRQLTDELAVFLGFQRILVVHLGNQQFKELVLAKVVPLDLAILSELVLLEYRTGTANAACSAHECALVTITDPASALSATWSWPYSSARRWSETRDWLKSCRPSLPPH